MKLLVFVPGLGSPDAATLLRRLGADLGPEWRVEVFDHEVRPWTIGRLDDVAYRLAVRVRTWAGDNGVGEPADEVLLVGHSLGGLLVRHAYLVDAGVTSDPPGAPYPWTSKVSRIVLLAAPNAGFDPRRMPVWERLPYVAAAAVGRFAAEDVQRGSPYVTELRLRWVRAFRSGGPRPTVVQVLGDRDDVVTRDDSLDVEYMAGATRIDVPGADHGDLVEVTDAPDDERYALLRRAILGDLGGRLAEVAADGAPVYFLLHGIRAGRYANWVGRLAERLAGNGAVVHTPTYGYLSAVEFALPFTRTRNLRRFLDWYCRLYVTHGESLHFAGHSNGTYLLGRALVAVPAMRFDRVYLAGSVLPRDYPWSEVERRGQVRAVHADRATADWPVGWLCAALRGLGRRDVGTAGFDGFDQASAVVREHGHAFRGGHGVALEPERLGEVAAFLRGSDTVHEPCAAPGKAFEYVSRFLGVAARPAALAGVAYAARWVASAPPGGRRRRVAAIGAGAAGVVLVGRSV